ALAVDLLQGFDRLDVAHDGQFANFFEQRRERTGQIEFEIDARFGGTVFDNRDRADIAVVVRNGARQPMQHAGAAHSAYQQTDFARRGIAQIVTSYFFSNPSQW